MHSMMYNMQLFYAQTLLLVMPLNEIDNMRKYILRPVVEQHMGAFIHHMQFGLRNRIVHFHSMLIGCNEILFASEDRYRDLQIGKLVDGLEIRQSVLDLISAHVRVFPVLPAVIAIQRFLCDFLVESIVI